MGSRPRLNICRASGASRLICRRGEVYTRLSEVDPVFLASERRTFYEMMWSVSRPRSTTPDSGGDKPLPCEGNLSASICVICGQIPKSTLQLVREAVAYAVAQSVAPPALQRFIARQSTDVTPSARETGPPPCHPDRASNASERRDPSVVLESAEFPTGLS